MVFEETGKYLETLAISVYPNIRIGSDFEKSYQCVDEIFKRLKKLVYARLAVESPADKFLSTFTIESDNAVMGMRWQTIFDVTTDDCVLGLETVLGSFRLNAEKLKENGTWSEDEFNHYIWRLNDYITLTKIRLNEFRNLYGHLIATKFKGICEKLSKWVECEDDIVMESIIMRHEVPAGFKKPVWIGNRADACRFMEGIGLYGQFIIFNSIISMGEGGELKTNNKPKKGTRKNQQLEEIISEIKEKK